MNQLTIKAEVSPGAEIDDAAIEACALANRTGVSVEFTFQDVTCIAMPNSDWKELVGTFYHMCAGVSKSRIAFAHTKEEEDDERDPE